MPLYAVVAKASEYDDDVEYPEGLPQIQTEDGDTITQVYSVPKINKDTHRLQPLGEDPKKVDSWYYNSPHSTVVQIVKTPAPSVDLPKRAQKEGRNIYDPNAGRYMTKKAFLGKYRVREESVISVPYKDFEDNAGAGCCASRFLGVDKITEGEASIQDLIDNCKRPLELYNIAGSCIYNGTGKGKKLYGMIAMNHIYKYVGTGKPKFILNDEYAEDDPAGQIVEVIKNGITYTADGITSLPVNIDNSIFKDCVKTFTHEEETNLSTPLLYYDRAEPMDRCAGLYEVDLIKAYQNIILNMGEHQCYGVFDAFDEWQTYNGEDIITYYYYNIDKPIQKYGINNTFMTGILVQALLDAGIQFNITHVKECSNVRPFTDLTKNIPKDLKGYNLNVYNGCLGRTRKISSELYTGLPTNELEQELMGSLELDDNGDYGYFKTYYKNLNYTSLYNLVVDTCSAKLIKLIHDNKHLKVLRIKTDSVTFYDIKKLKYNKDEYKLKPMYSYTPHTVNPRTAIIGRSQNSGSTQNITFLGPPGSGKSHKIKNEYKYDEAWALTHVCAKNIGGITLHKALMLFAPSKLYSCINKYRGKTIWVDEISMIPRDIFQIFAMMTETRFIFSGDMDQLPPVKGRKIDESLYILGDITRLTTNYRNDEKLLYYREHLDELKPSEKLPDNVDVHLSYTNKKRIEVNEAEMKKRGFNDITDKGVLVRCIKTDGKKGYYNGDVLTNEEILARGPTGLKDIKKYFDIGYCMTVHAKQGSTVNENMIIHEWHKMDKALKYTAVTRLTKFQYLHINI